MTTRRFAARGKERDGSAEFGSNLSRRCSPMASRRTRASAGRVRRLMQNPRRKSRPSTRGLPPAKRLREQTRRGGQRHSDRALAFALADGEQLDGLGGIDQEFVEP